MKTFRLIGMALLAIVLCVNFASCSSDDDEEPTKNDDGIITNQKQLMQIKMVDDSETITWDFAYDSKGRLISIIFAETTVGESTYRDITNYTWSNNTIIAEDGRSTRTYTINEGLVRTIRDTRNNDWCNVSFTYNSSKQVIAIKNIYGNETFVDTYTWENGKITDFTFDNYVTTYITYSGKTCKGYFPLYNPSDNDGIFYVHPELMGLRNSQLPDQMYSKDDDSEETEKCTYILDKDGYVESCIMVDTDIYNNPSQDINGDGIITDDEKNASNTSTYTSTTTYTFKWE